MPARQDQVDDPRIREELASARLGTAFFRRALNQLSDEDLDGPSLLPGWDRRHLVAHVGYNARGVARLVDWANTGVENPMYPSSAARAEEIELGSSLNPEALRTLSEHAAIDLDVRWRDLPPARWQTRVVTGQGREIPAAETVWIRCREVWLHAVDLDSGARIDDVPRPVLQRIVTDVLGNWAARGEAPVRLEITDAGDGAPQLSHDALPAGTTTVSGPLPALAAWVTGRLPAAGREHVLSWSDGSPVAAPRWI